METSSKPVVTDVLSFHMEQSDMLRMFAASEQNSEHPLDVAIVAYAKEQGSF